VDLASFRTRATAADTPVLVLDTDVVASLSCGLLIPLLEVCWPAATFITDSVYDELGNIIAQQVRPVSCASYGRGRPWSVDNVELDEHLDVRTSNLRMRLAAPSDPQSKHAGEASTLALVEGVVPHARAILQDADASRLAAALGLPFWPILELMNDFARQRQTTCADLHSAYLSMLRNGRSLPIGLQTDSFCQYGCKEHP
jgi:hypothetical protein